MSEPVLKFDCVNAPKHFRRPEKYGIKNGIQLINSLEFNIYTLEDLKWDKNNLKTFYVNYLVMNSKKSMMNYSSKGKSSVL